MSEHVEVARIASDMVARDKGILAADESIGTMNSRLAGVGVAPTRQNRRAFRELLVTTPGLADGVSGVILCDETFRQFTSDGHPFPRVIAERGMLPGIKVDTGAKPLAGAPGVTVTEGLDGLRDRLAEYAGLGAAFAKWRAVIVIGEGLSFLRARHANAHALARYAALCQEAGIVPIVEPEVLMEGTHSARACAAATAAMLRDVFAELERFGVVLGGMVLKPNMVLPGKASGAATTPDQVARATISTLRGTVPEGVAGVAFLSGGQSAVAATANLAAMRDFDAPWPLTFSFGRALVDPALSAWRGEPHRSVDGQNALAYRVQCNSAALRGVDRDAAGGTRVTA